MSKFKLPGRLYGREKEVASLNKKFLEISSGKAEILLVPGHSGAGKTSLVRQLQKPVEKSNGYFVHGKFDQFQQNIPYSAIRQALNELLLAIKKETPKKQQSLKKEILTKLDYHAQILIDLVPEFEGFLGKQPALGVISPQEAKHRFIRVFNSFLSILCKPETPIVIFIDDWQWADPASMQFIQELQIGKSIRYLLLIIAFRNNEIHEKHPFQSVLKDLNTKAIPKATLEVKNLLPEDVLKILTDSIYPTPDAIDELSHLIHSKTNGNPFFIISYLRFLHDFEYIYFDSELQSWRWSLHESNSKPLPDTLVDLFVTKINCLGENEKNLLSLASCLGNRINLDILATISNYNPDNCLSILNSKTLKDYVIPSNNAINLNKNNKTNSQNINFLFRHDQIQQAAYSIIEKKLLPHVLLRIGRIIHVRLKAGQPDVTMFEVVNKFNESYHLIRDHKEIITLVNLNMEAARKAHAATAYSSALAYYRMTETLLDNQSVFLEFLEADQEKTVMLLKEHAQCEFLEGEQNKAHVLINKALDLASGSLSKADIYNLLIVQYTLQSNYKKAIDAGRKALALLGIFLADSDYEDARNSEIAKMRSLLASSETGNKNTPDIMTERKILLACKILITMGPPCYRFHQKLWSVMVPKVVSLTIEYGSIPQVGYSHTAIGGLLIWVDNDFRMARDFSEQATRLMTQKFKSPSDSSVYYLMIGSSIRHWFKPMKYSSQDYADAYDIGLQSGNLQYAAYAFGHNMYCSFFQGIPLNKLTKESKKSLEFSETRHNQWAIDLLQGGIAVFDNLSATKNQATPQFKDKNYLKEVAANKNIQVQCIYGVMKSFALMLMNENKQALAVSDQIMPILYTVGSQGLLPWPEHMISRALIMAALYEEADAYQKKSYLAEIIEIKKNIALWSQNCKENFAFKFYLITAELYRIQGHPNKAVRYYNLAISDAKEEGFLQWEAIANEKASMFWKINNFTDLSLSYWQRAHVCYTKWGATNKIIRMEAVYQQEFIETFRNNSRISGEGFENYMLNKLAKERIQQLQSYSQQMLKNSLQQETEENAKELSEAAQRLRIEVAERKKAEKKIKENNQVLQTLNNEKDRFFSIIAHDLKSPFNTILGLSEMLFENAKSGKMNRIKEFSGIIYESSKSAVDLLINLMEWSQSQTGRLKYSPVWFNIYEKINQEITLLRETANQKQIEIQFARKEIFVFADVSMTRTIIRNLVSNAIKFTNPGGKITVTLQYNQGESVVEVCDTGIGIDQQTTKNLFRTDINNSTLGTKNEKGTGLGLILCKEFIEKHKGKIWVESTPGEGTCFYFTLPKSQEKTHPETVTGLDKHPVSESIPTILIADDEDTNFMLIDTILKENLQSDCHILRAKNGEEALKICQEESNISLVFMDIRMPVMDGITATRLIKKHNPTLPVIAQTTYSARDNKDLFDGYIEKPVRLQSILAIIHEFNKIPSN